MPGPAPAQPDRDTLHKRLRAAWGFSGMSYTETAEAVGVSEDTVRNYLRRDGRYTIPPAEVIDRLLQAFGVPPAFLFEGFASNAAGELRVELQEVREAAARAEVALGLALDDLRTAGADSGEAAAPARTRRR